MWNYNIIFLDILQMLLPKAMWTEYNKWRPQEQLKSAQQQQQTKVRQMLRDLI